MTARRTWAVIAGVVAVAVGAIGWDLRGCVAEQKGTVSQVRELWSKVRMNTQKYFDEQSAFHDKAGIFLDKIGGSNPTAASIERDKQWLISGIETLNRDCNHVRGARYNFSNAWAHMERMFLVQHSAWPDISGQCAGWLPLIEQLRSVDSRELASNRQYRQQFYSTKDQMDIFYQDLQRNREAERKQAKDVEEIFRIIDSRDLLANCWTCMKIAVGSK